MTAVPACELDKCNGIGNNINTWQSCIGEYMNGTICTWNGDFIIIPTTLENAIVWLSHQKDCSCEQLMMMCFQCLRAAYYFTVIDRSLQVFGFWVAFNPRLKTQSFSQVCDENLDFGLVHQNESKIPSLRAKINNKN